MNSIPVVAIIGRSNVGKSTLFNALLNRRKAIVKDEAGVTRDRTSALVKTDDFTFTLVDTAGLFGSDKETEMEISVFAQTRLAIDESDLILAMFDGRHGLHPQDPEVVALIRESKKPVIWIINKCESQKHELAANEFYGLGIDNLLCISAAHRKNLKDLTAAIKENFPENLAKDDENSDTENSAIRIAILGKPNAGKSTLVNQIIGKERMVTSNVAGTTRDSIEVPFLHGEQEFVLIDTAGLRRKARVEGVSVERYANIRSLGALAKCDVAVLLLDATLGPPTDQDLKIAQLIHERGRGLIIAINKWDAVEKDHKTAKSFKDVVQGVFRFARYAPIVYISALTGRRCKTILDKAQSVIEQGKTRVKTSDLNRILSRAFEANQPPVFRGEPVKLYFATQIEGSPPTIVLFLNHPRHINTAYQRYLKNAIREEYAFDGYDIKLKLRKRTEREQQKGS
jgi:GTPase